MEKHFVEFDKAQEKLDNQLIVEIEALCDRYKVHFKSGMGTYLFGTENITIDLWDRDDRATTNFWIKMNKLCDNIEKVDGFTRFCGMGFDYQYK